MQTEHHDQSNLDPHQVRDSKDKTETVKIGNSSEDDEKSDVITDPALDDRIGSDWTNEGGATQVGPATDSPGAD